MHRILFMALFAVGLGAIAPASFARTHVHAPVGTISHSRTWHRIVLSPDVASSFDAAPGWSGVPSLSRAHQDDVPSYDDPSKFGGSTALPIN